MIGSVRFDETSGCDALLAHPSVKLESIYFFNLEEKVHVCDTTPSYNLYLGGFELTGGYDLSPEDSEIMNDLLTDIDQEDNVREKSAYCASLLAMDTFKRVHEYASIEEVVEAYKENPF